MMRSSRILMRSVLAAVIAGATLGCESPRDQGLMTARQVEIGDSGITPAEVQSTVMSFADTYAATVGQAYDSILVNPTIDPRIRREAHDAKLGTLSSAFSIAIEPNPLVAMLDMAAMVRLQRRVAATHWVPKVYGDELGAPLLVALEKMDEEMRGHLETLLIEDDLAAFDDMINEWLDANPEQTYTDYIRLSAYARERQVQQVRTEGRSSLLALFALDPLANLDPTTREIMQSRLLAERGFYWAKRAPYLLRFVVEGSIYQMAVEPEVEALLENADRLTVVAEDIGAVSKRLADVSERVTVVAEELPERIATEREAAVADLAQRVTEERTAAIDQLMTGITEQREAIWVDLEQQRETIAPLLTDIRATAEASRDLVDSIGVTLNTADTMMQSIQANRSEVDREPLTIEEIGELADGAKALVERMDDLVDSVNDLLASPNWEERASLFSNAGADVRSGATSVVDHTVQRGIVLIVIFLVGFTVSLLVYRFVATKLFK